MRVWCLEEKHLCFFQVSGELALFFSFLMKCHFCQKNITDRLITLIKFGYLAKVLRSDRSEPVTLRKMIDSYFLPVIKLSFQVQIRILEIYLPGLKSFPELKNFPDEISDGINECDFFEIVVLISNMVNINKLNLYMKSLEVQYFICIIKGS